MAANIYDLSTTAASNTTIDGVDVSGATGKVKDGDNVMRSLAAFNAQWIDDQGGVATTAGTANAQTVTLASGFTAYAAGQIFRVKIGSGLTNTSSTVTINVNSIGTKTVKVYRGSALADPAVGDIREGNYGLFLYDGTYLVLLNPGLPVVTTVRTQVLTSSGTYTPHANMLYCVIECVGGGGGGGGAAASGGSVSSSGAGGGAGGYSRKIASKADIGASQTVTIGALGAGGSTGNNAGSAGGDTSVGSLCIAKGGSGGGSASAGGIGAKALGGVAGTGDFTPTGAGSNPGGIGVFSGTVGVIAVGSAGASSIYGGGGAGATAGVGAGNGTAATSYGSGGGGGATQNSSGGTAAGGNGSAGVVVITEFCSA